MGYVRDKMRAWRRAHPNPRRDRKAKARVLYFIGRRPAFPVPPKVRYPEDTEVWERPGRHPAKEAVFLSPDPLGIALGHGRRGNVYAYQVPWTVIKKSGGLKRYTQGTELMISKSLWPQVRFLGKVMDRDTFRNLVHQARGPGVEEQMRWERRASRAPPGELYREDALRLREAEFDRMARRSFRKSFGRPE